MNGKFDIDDSQRSSSFDKAEHIRLCLEEDMESSRSNGFERYRLNNNPLPEIAFDEVELSARFLEKHISAPFVISPMTGGTQKSRSINRNLAAAAQQLQVAMSVGSQRLAFEDDDLADSYRIRDVAPDIPIVANIGAVYLNYGVGLRECERLVEMIDADALGIYLNPMQTIMQGRRNLNFKNLVEKIADICRNLSVPVLVKEVGFGISGKAAVMLQQAGATVLDVAGAGGTSWAKITRRMRPEIWGDAAGCFENWGIPTADALIGARSAAKSIRIIASGGIRNGVEMAKAIALGADYVGMALPLLAPAAESAEAVVKRIEIYFTQLRIAMFCCGARTIADLRSEDMVTEVDDYLV